MNKVELLKIKEYALERHIPIIMDDTLEVIDKYLTFSMHAPRKMDIFP